MLNFIKVFGKGILYIVCLPLILAYLGLYAVYCLIMFFYMALRNIVVFFSGGKINGDLKEDIEAKKILMSRQEKQDAVNDLLLRAYAQNPMPNPQPINSQTFSTTTMNQEQTNTLNQQIEDPNNDTDID